MKHELPDSLLPKFAEYPHCSNAYLTDEAVQHRKRLQCFMLESARPCFDDKDSESLGIIVRLVVEFYYYAQVNCTHRFCAEYMSGSIRAGVDWFCDLTHMYRILEGSTPSSLDWNCISIPSLKAHFSEIFRDFDKEILFERQCRLLLDLYKLMIVFAGVSYD